MNANIKIHYKKCNKEYQEVVIIEIYYKNKKIQKLFTNSKYATRELGKDISRTLMRRIEEIKAFEKFSDIPAGKPWKREKISKNEDRWSLRVNDEYRIELSIDEDNKDLKDIEKIIIERVSNHYE